MRVLESHRVVDRLLLPASLAGRFRRESAQADVLPAGRELCAAGDRRVVRVPVRFHGWHDTLRFRTSGINGNGEVIGLHRNLPGRVVPVKWREPLDLLTQVDGQGCRSCFQHDGGPNYADNYGR